MAKFLKQIRFENESIGCIKFIRGNYLVAAHNNNITIMSSKDDFNAK